MRKKYMDSVEKDIYKNNLDFIPFDFERLMNENNVESTIYLSGNRINIEDIISQQEEIDELTE